MTIYIAFYKGHGGNWWQRTQDRLIRFFTRGKYSHCEIAELASPRLGAYNCFTSSPRDGGVRIKGMGLPSAKWDLIAIEGGGDEAAEFYLAHKGKKYDWLGVLGFVLRTKQSPNRYFCSEYVAEFLGFPEPWRFSPNDLYAILKRKQP